MEEPFGVWVVEICEMSEGRQVTFRDTFANWVEFLSKTYGFLTLVDTGRGETAEDDVGGDQVYQNESTLLGAFGVTLVVCGLKSKLSTVEMVIGEVIAAKVVKKGDALRSWEEGKRRRLLVDVAEDLLCTAKLTAMKEKL